MGSFRKRRRSSMAEEIKPPPLRTVKKISICREVADPAASVRREVPVAVSVVLESFSTDRWIFTTPNSEKFPKLSQRENQGSGAIAAAAENRTAIEAENSGFVADKRRLPLSKVVADCVERWFEDALKEARPATSICRCSWARCTTVAMAFPKTRQVYVAFGNLGEPLVYKGFKSEVNSPPLRAVNKASVCREVPNPASVHQEFSTAASVFSAPPQRAVNTFGSSPRFHPSVKFQPPLQSGVKLQSPPLLNTLVFPSASATGTTDTETSALKHCPMEAMLMHNPMKVTTLTSPICSPWQPSLSAVGKHEIKITKAHK
ncbi:NAD(P)-binding Rossmann-fold superfamily protein [Striga asiatica]|uniref:NAD(P)-binding Rossmann-fold superfamily protein n=1 Tax=Striga asiatica TaxID=4170 RepID=A0A5A7PTH2_STRAF|nr:NAD(P)-binding Rossmann-fold superfamily protein [Striga asiatica]